MTAYDYKRARARHYRAKRLRRSLGWLVFGVVVLVLVVGGIALAASRPVPAGGGRTMPASVPASPAFLRIVAAKVGHLPKVALLQNCMGSKCVVYSRDRGTVVTLVKRGGVWRVTTMIGGDGSMRGTA